jgi:purine-cytosine permease-like protein
LLIFPLLWLPVVADFARFGRNPWPTARGTFTGVFVASAWFGILGLLYLPATDSGDIPGFVVGMQLGLGALALLLILQADEIYASAYATFPVLESLGAGRLARILAALLVVIASAAAVQLHVGDLEGYVVLAGSVFVPAFAIVIARSVWAAPRSPLVPALAWVCGFALYQWISPAGIGWWRDALDSMFETAGQPFPLTDEATWLGAAVPSFLLAFALDMLGPALTRLLSPRGEGRLAPPVRLTR